MTSGDTNSTIQLISRRATQKNPILEKGKDEYERKEGKQRIIHCRQLGRQRDKPYTIVPDRHPRSIDFLSYQRSTVHRTPPPYWLSSLARFCLLYLHRKIITSPCNSTVRRNKSYIVLPYRTTSLHRICTPHVVPWVTHQIESCNPNPRTVKKCIMYRDLILQSWHGLIFKIKKENNIFYQKEQYFPFIDVNHYM
jgi:hypothetical protein